MCNQKWYISVGTFQLAHFSCLFQLSFSSLLSLCVSWILQQQKHLRPCRWLVSLETEQDNLIVITIHHVVRVCVSVVTSFVPIRSLFEKCNQETRAWCLCAAMGSIYSLHIHPCFRLVWWTLTVKFSSVLLLCLSLCRSSVMTVVKFCHRTTSCFYKCFI